MSSSGEGSRHRVGAGDLAGHGVRIEQREQGGEIPVPGGGQEGGDDPAVQPGQTRNLLLVNRANVLEDRWLPFRMGYLGPRSSR
jgi:hypothetical protein